MTVALEGVEWSAAGSGRTLPPGNSRYQFYRRLGELQGRFGRAKYLAPTGVFLFLDPLFFVLVYYMDTFNTLIMCMRGRIC